MPNITNKKISEIHQSIINIGGTNKGITSSSIPICDGNGNSIGISLSETKVDMNLRRGVLSNYQKKGVSSSALYADMSFPNNLSLTAAVTPEQSMYIADLDVYSGARIHFIRDDFNFQIAMRSKYFDQAYDGYPTVVGYWQKGYGKNKYFLVNNGVAEAQLNLDTSLYFLEPSPSDVTRPISGLIKKYGQSKGIQHPKSFVEFKLILSCEEGLNINISESIRKIRDFEGSDTAYTSVSDLIKDFSDELYVSHKINFDSFNIGTNPQVFLLRFYNPTLWNVGFTDISSPCALFGAEVAPNVDYRFYLMAQNNIVIYKL